MTIFNLQEMLPYPHIAHIFIKHFFRPFEFFFRFQINRTCTFIQGNFVSKKNLKARKKIRCVGIFFLVKPRDFSNPMYSICNFIRVFGSRLVPVLNMILSGTLIKLIFWYLQIGRLELETMSLIFFFYYWFSSFNGPSWY